MASSAEARAEHARARYATGKNGYANVKRKRAKRVASKSQHSNQKNNHKQYGEEK